MHANISMPPSTFFYTATTDTSDKGIRTDFKGLDGAGWKGIECDPTARALHKPASELLLTDMAMNGT